MLHAQETFENGTEGHIYGESPVYETAYDSPGKLYRALQAEYGRCAGKVYVDLPGKPATAVGWIFEGRAEYEDSADTYLRRVWVTVHDAPDTVTRERHYHGMGQL